MFSSTLRRSLGPSPIRQYVRSISTLLSNPHIYVFPNPDSSNEHVLTLLDTSPPNPDLAIGMTTAIPPTPDSLRENPKFMGILYEVLAQHAADDPLVQGQAAAFASSSGSALGSGGVFFPQQRRGERGVGGGKGRGGQSSKVGDGAGGASSQGGAGGGGRGGWVHVSDSRAPPDYGRIAWPEDIFGSLEVDGRGVFVDGGNGEEGKGGKGNWQTSGSYRVVTREGILGLSGYLRGKVVERLRREEKGN